MSHTSVSQCHDCTCTFLRCEIAGQQNQVLDFDVVVNDCRQAVDPAFAKLRASVFARDRAAARLADLIDRADDIGFMRVGATEVSVK